MQRLPYVSFFTVEGLIFKMNLPKDMQMNRKGKHATKAR